MPKSGDFWSNKNYAKMWNKAPRLYKPQTLAETFSDWELMDLAKIAPGMIHAPYVASMSSTSIPTGEFKTSLSMNLIRNVANEEVKIGVEDFTVFFF